MACSYRKEHHTPLDRLPIEGMYFVDGDLFDAQHKVPFLVEQKLPWVAFPSGLNRRLNDPDVPQHWANVEVSRQVQLPYRSTRDQALALATANAQGLGYALLPFEDDQIELWHANINQRFRVFYDNDAAQMMDVSQVDVFATPPTSKHPALQYLTDTLSQQLHPFDLAYKVQIDRFAPVRYFAPDGFLSLYASHFDGDENFFGLVTNLNTVRLDYFSLTQLTYLKGRWGLQLERDLSYIPQTLDDLMTYHRQRL